MQKDMHALAVAEHLAVAVVKSVNDGNDLWVFCQAVLLLLRYKWPELVDVDGGLPELVFGLVEVSHTNLTEVARVVLVEVGTKIVSEGTDLHCHQAYAPMVVLTTSKTTTSGMLAVLADTTVTGWYVSAVLASVAETGRHFLQRVKAKLASYVRIAEAHPAGRGQSIVQGHFLHSTGVTA
jgi:hypothetical protein